MSLRKQQLEFANLKWTFLPAANRNAAFDVIDVSITDTWETADQSNITGSKAVVLFGFMQIGSTQVPEQMQLLVREFGSSDTSFARIITQRMHAAHGPVSANIYMGNPVLIYCNGGKWQYRRGSSSYKVDIMTFTLWGWGETQ